MNSNINKIPKSLIHQKFVAELKKCSSLTLVNLSTVDGFLLHQVNRNSLSIEGDKVAAISSSLSALANSATKELLSDTNSCMNIECNSGKIIYQQVKPDVKPAVITLCCSNGISLAEARFIAKRLKKSVEELFCVIA